MYQKDLLKNKRILVTGGGTGLGRAMGEHFLQHGAQLVICGRRKGVCDEAAEQMMQQCGGKVSTYGVDIRDAAAVDEMVEDIFVNGGLDGLMNNAAGNFISRTEDISPRGFDAVANIVMHGTFYVTSAVGKRWIAQQKANPWKPGVPMKSICSIITTWVLNGGPYVVPSAMSKSAIHTMTMSLAAEWAKYGIRINAIGPGEIPTEGMNKRLAPGDTPGARTIGSNPMMRCGEMAELQNLASFLMSSGCDWLSGQSIMMDGAGYLAHGGGFWSTLRNWDDQKWGEARAAIESQNKKDRAQRTV
jgi:NAD(P)-dependent dehydrogenase (short-subunit alcohol dehydrogenase family)